MHWLSSHCANHRNMHLTRVVVVAEQQQQEVEVAQVVRVVNVDEKVQKDD